MSTVAAITLQALTPTVCGGDDPGLRVGEQHRQAVRGEHTNGDVLAAGHLGIALDHLHFGVLGLNVVHHRLARTLRLGLGLGMGTGCVETERLVLGIDLVDVHRLARMHLVDERELHMEFVGKRLAVALHSNGVVAGLASKIEVRPFLGAHASQTGGVNDGDAGREHHRNRHWNRVALVVGGFDGRAVENGIVIGLAVGVLPPFACGLVFLLHGLLPMRLHRLEQVIEIDLHRLGCRVRVLFIRMLFLFTHTSHNSRQRQPHKRLQLWSKHPAPLCTHPVASSCGHFAQFGSKMSLRHVPHRPNRAHLHEMTDRRAGPKASSTILPHPLTSFRIAAQNGQWAALSVGQSAPNAHNGQRAALTPP